MARLKSENSFSLGKHNKDVRLMKNALKGDMSFSILPLAVASAATAAAFTRNVEVSVVDENGDIHDWLSDTYATTLSIGDTSSAGTASIASTTLTLVDGKATVVVSGDAEAWLGGTAQIETITCTAGESTGAGDITMTITAAGMDNTPKAVVVPVALSDGVNDVGLALRTALAADADVSAFFTVSGADAAAILTAITPAANDATLAFGFVDTDSTGVTFGASTNTEAGVAKETDTLTVGNITVLGYTVTGGTSVETFS